MENQHRLIRGYRDLTDAEITQMNVIKQHGENLRALVEEMINTEGLDQRWVAIGRTRLQEGIMALTRAVAQPTSF